MRAQAKYKVYETIQNLTDRLIRIRYMRQHVDFIPSDQARDANHAIFAARALHRIAAPSRAPDLSVPRTQSRQRQSLQSCGSHACNPHATRWKLGCEGHEQPIRRHVSTSSFQLGKTRYAADHAHLLQPTDAWPRGKALTTMLLATKLMQPAFASKPAECLIRVRW